jgi:hypothetical protein
LGHVQIIALDIKDSVPSCAVIFKRDLPAQLHQLFFGKLFARTRIQIWIGEAVAELRVLLEESQKKEI